MMGSYHTFECSSVGEVYYNASLFIINNEYIKRKHDMLVEQIEKNSLIATYPTDKFKYNKEKNQFIGNINDLKYKEFFNPIYKDDLTTVGFILKSAKTGKEKVFYHTETIKRNGDIISWVFKDEETGKITVKLNNY